MRPSPFALRAALATILLPLSSAQQSAWAPAATCSAGGAQATGGAYTDQFGAVWNVNCTGAPNGASIESAVGTNGRGIYGCFEGCDKRPRCTAF